MSTISVCRRRRSTASQLFSASDSLTDNATSQFIMGIRGGLGIDIMLYAGLFLRAEWEYLRFSAEVETSVNTVSAGLGYKF